MRESVLQRKEARIVVALAAAKGVSAEQALDLFYNSHTYDLLKNPDTGLHLMSDGYVLQDLLEELK